MWLHFNPGKDALFLDVDGTLLDIAPTAQKVKVSRSLVRDLGRLNRKLGGALAFVSGRMIHELDSLFSPLRLCSAGAHGAEWRLSPKGPVQTGALLPDVLRDNIALAFANMDGVIIEDKIYNVAVHYRQVPQKAGIVGRTLARLIGPYNKTVKLVRGRKVFEVMPLIHDKGKALEKFLAIEPFKNRRPVFLGDDVADISAIGACLKKGGVAARVGQGKSRQGYAFASPKHVRMWISRLADGKGFLL